MNGGANTNDTPDPVRRWFEELFNDTDLDVADEILAEDVSYHGPTSLSPRDVDGPADIKEYVRTYATAFPDLTYSIEDVFDAGEAVTVRWSVTGTHEADLYEMESTGETFGEEGLSLFILEGDRIARVHSEWDTLKMGQELDVVPPIGEG